jgi:GDPmannose 4,6-dehydratase
MEIKKPPKKKAIITGITGQDGSHLADYLLSLNYQIVGVARRSSSDTTSRIKHILNHKDFKLVEGDITDYSSMLNIVKNHNDACELYNLAAQSHVGTSFKQPEVTWDATCRGCFNLLQIIVDLDLTKAINFYQASSSEMFGKSYDSDGYGKYQKETTKFMPQSPYGIAKTAAHEAVRLYREAYDYTQVPAYYLIMKAQDGESSLLLER